MKHTTSIGYRKFKALDDFVSKEIMGKSKMLIQYSKISIEISIKKKQELDFDTDLYTVLSSIEDTIRERYVK